MPKPSCSENRIRPPSSLAPWLGPPPHPPAHAGLSSLLPWAGGTTQTSSERAELPGSAEIRALFAAVADRATSWVCDNVACQGTGDRTLNYCVTCKHLWCHECGGPTAAQPPIPAFECIHCTVEAETAGLDLTPDQRALLKHLARGRYHLLSLQKRSSSRSNDLQGLKAYYAFCDLTGLAAFPATSSQLIDFMVYGVNIKNWDSSTVGNRVQAIGSLYAYLRVFLGWRFVRSPLREPAVIEAGRILGANFKKEGGGRLPLSFAELHGLMARGFVGRTRRGRWARLYNIVLNFLMLRNVAASHLRVEYDVHIGADGRESVVFTSKTEIGVRFDTAFGADIVYANVREDKNVDARRAAEGGRKAYCPAVLPNFGIDFGRDLVEYILYVRPPSGGPLLIRPSKKGFGFDSVKSNNFSKDYLQPAYRQAFPDVSPDYLRRLGTHSGRLTLAQLLWNAGFERRLIADAGGWFIKREAVDLYFSTASLHILQAMAALNFSSVVRQGQL